MEDANSDLNRCFSEWMFASLIIVQNNDDAALEYPISDRWLRKNPLELRNGLRFSSETSISSVNTSIQLLKIIDYKLQKDK